MKSNLDQWKGRIQDLTDYESKVILIPFLLFIKERYEDYFQNRITDNDLADLTINWSIEQEEFSSNLFLYEPSLLQLKILMNLSSSELTNKQKERMVRKALCLVDHLLKTKK